MNLLARSSLSVAGSRTPKKLHFESIRIMSATRPHTSITDEMGPPRHWPAHCHLRVRSRANPSAPPRERLRTGLWVEADFSTANSVWRSQTNARLLRSLGRRPRRRLIVRPIVRCFLRVSLHGRSASHSRNIQAPAHVVKRRSCRCGEQNPRFLDHVTKSSRAREAPGETALPECRGPAPSRPRRDGRPRARKP